MELVEIGSTAEGRTQLMAIISSEENLARLDRYKEISRRLSQARGLTDDEARELAREGKAVIWIDFGLHSNEVAHAQTAPLMAYHAVTDESEEMRKIRDDVIFLLVPNMNPDGTTLVADWYMKHVGTPFENAPLPELYQKYVGHDDNRDWYMFNMPETRNVGRQLYAEWFPQIIYNQHQTGPFPARIFIPPFADPMNPDIPAEVMRGIATVGSAMSRRFEQENKPGVISRIRFDTWWNGGMRSTPYYHNMIGILTETQHNSATPAHYDSDDFPKTFSNGAPTLEPSTFYPNPFRGGEWHLKDSCDYMMTASMAVLDIGSRRSEEWLYGVYKMGRDAIEAGESETFVVPARQWDPSAAARMIDALRWGGIEIGRATKPFLIRDQKYRAGSYLISSAQPYRAHLRNLLTKQTYPDRRQYPDGPPIVPYDIAGWTLPMQMGVQVDRYALAVADVDLENVEWSALRQVKHPGQARYGYALDPRTNGAALAVNRLLKARQSVLRLAAPLAGEGGEWPAGSFIVKSEGGVTIGWRDSRRTSDSMCGVWTPSRRGRSRASPCRASASITRGAATWTKAGRAGCWSSSSFRTRSCMTRRCGPAT